MIEEGYIALSNVLTDARSLVVDAEQWPGVEAVLKRGKIAYWGFIDFTESKDGAYCVGVSVHAADMPRINELLGWDGSYAGDKGQGWRWLAAVVGLLAVAILLGAVALALGVTP